MRIFTRCCLSSLFLVTLLHCIVAMPVYAASNFVRFPLGKGASIEIPKNWVVLSENQRTTIGAFVEAKGYRQTEATLNFAANLYDDHGKSLALVNARFYPDNPITQDKARQATSADLMEIDVELRQAIEAPQKAMGVRMLKLYGSKIQVINGLYVLVHEHRNSGAGDAGVARVRGLRVWRSPRSFTVTLMYRELDAAMLLPIIDYMTNSLRQD